MSRSIAAVLLAGTLGLCVLDMATWAGRRRPAPPLEERPGLRLSPAQLDLGERCWNSITPFEFQLVNDTADPIEIREIKLSCGCMTLPGQDYRGALVQGRQQLSLKGELRTAARLGRLERTLTVLASDGREATGHIVAVVAPTYRFEPERVDMGQVSAGTGDISRRVAFKSDHGVLTGRMESDSHWLTGSVDGDSIEVHVLTDELPLGKTFGRLTVETTDFYMPSCTIPVTIDHVADIVLAPSRLFLADDDPHVVRALGANGQPLRISSFECSAPDLRIEITELGHARISRASDGAGVSRVFRVRLTDEQDRSAFLEVTTVNLPPRAQGLKKKTGE